MLNRFSFANDVARLQSGPAEYAWTAAADFYGDAGPSVTPFAAVIHSITGDPADSGPPSVPCDQLHVCACVRVRFCGPIRICVFVCER